MAANRRTATTAEIYELKVTLLDSNPPIWRRVAVPSEITLDKLHQVVQIVMGWTDSHLHQFETEDDVRYESKDHGGPDSASTARNERRAHLKNVVTGAGGSLLYQYDFGDGWDHRLEVLRVGLPEPGVSYPVCLAGERACPPDDCGGIWGYYDMLAAVANPDHEDHEEMTEWLGPHFDPEVFERDDVNKLLASLR